MAAATHASSVLRGSVAGRAGLFALLALLCAVFVTGSSLAFRPWRPAAPLVAPPASSVAEPPTPPAPLSVVLLAIDGVRWQDLHFGVDPELARAHGLDESEIVSASVLVPTLAGLAGPRASSPQRPAMRATGPNFISLPGYAELLTGRGPSFCHDNACSGPTEPTLFDDLSAAHGCGAAQAAAITSWPDVGRIVAQRLDCVALSSGRNGGRNLERFRADTASRRALERGQRAHAYPGYGDFRPDEVTAELALAHFEHAAPRFLFVALGETDEYGHRGDYRGYLQALRASDAFVERLLRRLLALSERGHRTALLVTTDHGRAHSFREHGVRHPESAYVWLAAGGSELRWRAQRETSPRRLADVAPTLRRLLGLPRDPSPRAGEPLVELLAGEGVPH